MPISSSMKFAPDDLSLYMVCTDVVHCNFLSDDCDDCFTA